MYNRKKYFAMGKVFVHGLGQASESWNAVLLSMEEPEKCVCPNLVESVKNQNVHYKNLYNAFLGLCDKFDESIDLCGMSSGGVLTLNYAIERPNKVKSLVLIATLYKMPKMLLKNARVEIVSGAGHQVNVEVPDELRKLLSSI